MIYNVLSDSDADSDFDTDTVAFSAFSLQFFSFSFLRFYIIPFTQLFFYLSFLQFSSPILYFIIIIIIPWSGFFTCCIRMIGRMYLEVCT